MTFEKIYRRNLISLKSTFLWIFSSKVVSRDFMEFTLNFHDFPRSFKLNHRR